MRYSVLVDVYEKIEATTKRIEMRDLLAELFKKTPKDTVEMAVYLTQGKLYPDYVGIELGMADKLIIRAIALASGKDEKTVESIYKTTGDLGEAVEKLLTKKMQQTLTKTPLTVEDVYRSFDKIARSSGPGSVEAKVKLLCSLLNDATPKEAKYIVRMALGRLRLGVADMTILEGLSIAYLGDVEGKRYLERAYNLSSDLGLIARTVAQSGLDGILNLKVKVGRPIRPMLAERLSDPAEILGKLGGKAAAEYKYDGLRVQAHITPGNTTLFSRRLENITEQFPDVAKHLRDSLMIREAILEGECVAVDPNTGDMLPFQMVSQRRGRKYDVEKMMGEVPVKVFLFDLLYIDGLDYTLKPYPERREMLTKIIRPSEHVAISGQLVTENPQEIEGYMEKAISEGCEGLMLKSVGSESIYQAGARGWLWIKYKRAYKSEMADTVDLVVVGAFHGRGKRGGGYGALLLAAYDEDEDIFRTVCKCGSGFTDQDLEELPKRLKPLQIPHRHPRVDSKITADIWFVPNLVLEIIGDEITLSPVHTACLNMVRPNSGLAIRFPRFTGNYRQDKAPEDANTTKEILEMYQRQLKKISAD
ncbi:ATP-dependent DNA ligase [Candidatus Bathyarchaeota archaeon]|nr:ATP-dependent DNA ligase [Candidatus Bathyarchaeota archaeon]